MQEARQEQEQQQQQQQLVTSLFNPEVVAALSAQIPAQLAAQHSQGALLTTHVSDSDSEASATGDDDRTECPGSEIGAELRNAAGTNNCP